MLSVLEEHAQECLDIGVTTSITLTDVILTFTRSLRRYGKRERIRSDHGAEFTVGGVIEWLRDRNVGPSFIPPDKPWHYGFVESFNGKSRDECLNREWFGKLREARTVIESWRQFYNRRKPRSALGYQISAQFCEQSHNIAVRLTNLMDTKMSYPGQGRLL